MGVQGHASPENFETWELLKSPETQFFLSSPENSLSSFYHHSVYKFSAQKRTFDKEIMFAFNRKIRSTFISAKKNPGNVIGRAIAHPAP